MIEFERAVARDRGKVFQFLIAKTRGDADLAEDLLQTAILRAFKGWERFDGRSSFSAWLTAIAINVFRYHLKGESRRGVSMSLDAPLNDDGLTLDFPSDERTADDLVLDEAAVADFNRRLRRLPKKYRAALAHSLNGIEYEEMATLLRVPVGTVKSRIHRARAMMQESITRNPLGIVPQPRTCAGGARKRGWDRTGSRNRSTVMRMGDVVRLYLAGDSLRTISAKTGLSGNTIKSIKKQAALPSRTTAYRSSRDAAARPNLRGGRARTREEMRTGAVAGQ